MNDRPGTREPRPADPHPELRLSALVAVTIGVLLLAAAAFVLSYGDIHQIALSAGVSPRLARAYPVIFDAMLVVAFASALALRGAGWWSRLYVWVCTLALLAAVAAGDAVRAMAVALPRRPSAAVVAVIPWVLLLIAFGFLLLMLRHLRRSRAAAAAGNARPAAPHGPGYDAGQPARHGLDALLDPRPAIAAPALGDRLTAGTQRRTAAPPRAQTAARTGTQAPADRQPARAQADRPPAQPAPQAPPAAAARPAANKAPAVPAASTAAQGVAAVPAVSTPAADESPAGNGEHEPAANGEHEPAGNGEHEPATGNGHAPAAGNGREPAASGEPAPELAVADAPLAAPPAPFDRLRSTPTPPQD